MKGALRYLVPVLSLGTTVLGQSLTANEAALLAWRAYGDIIRQYLTAGTSLVKGTDFIYVTPPSTQAVQGGTVVPEAVTNFQVFPLGDAMQSVDDPLLESNGPSYVQALDIYLNSVSLGIGAPTPAQLAKIHTLTNNLATAQSNFWSAQATAQSAWMNDIRAQAKGTSFSAWIKVNDPLYITYQNQMQAANSVLQNYVLSVYGPEYQALVNQRQNIEFLAQDELNSNPGYNMPVFPGVYNVKLEPWQQNTITDGILYKPQYSLDNSFPLACDTWFNSTQKTTTITWSMQGYSSSDWSSLGHSTSVSQVSSSSFWVLAATHASSTTITTFDQWTSKFSSSVTMELTMNGSPEVFNIGSGYWDVPDVRKTYPKLISTGVDNLSGYVRLEKILVAYEVGLKITFTDTELWTSVSSFIENSISSAAGGISLLGFHVGSGSTSTYSRNTTSITLTHNSNGGVIDIAPTPPGMTFMLGALGKAV